MYFLIWFLCGLFGTFLVFWGSNEYKFKGILLNTHAITLGGLVLIIGSTLIGGITLVLSILFILSDLTQKVDWDKVIWKRNNKKKGDKK